MRQVGIQKNTWSTSKLSHHLTQHPRKKIWEPISYNLNINNNENQKKKMHMFKKQE